VAISAAAAILTLVRARGNSRLGCLALAACLLAVAPATALGDDANSLPPDLELNPTGTNQDPVGLHGGSLASYSTGGSDSSRTYSADSKVSFACLIDGQSAPCSASYHQVCCSVAVPKAARVLCPRRTRGTAKASKKRRRRCRPARWPVSAPYVPEGKALGLGPYTGWVPIPEGLANGTHTVTVIASDEDGVDPNPPTVTTVYDIVAPAAPKIVTAPPRVSRDPKPKFRYTAVDERMLYDKYNDPFSASLRRIKPPGPRLHTGDPFGSYLEWRGPFCPTEFTCTEVAWAAYSGAGEGGTTFGIREHLSPGLYEFSVSVSDTVLNESPAAKYRFRVLKPRSRRSR
jgi:hypothetical protein